MSAVIEDAIVATAHLMDPVKVAINAPQTPQAITTIRIEVPIALPNPTAGTLIMVTTIIIAAGEVDRVTVHVALPRLKKNSCRKVSVRRSLWVALIMA